jgi:hypothetical protein
VQSFWVDLIYSFFPFEMGGIGGSSLVEREIGICTQ